MLRSKENPKPQYWSAVHLRALGDHCCCQWVPAKRQPAKEACFHSLSLLIFTGPQSCFVGNINLGRPVTFIQYSSFSSHRASPKLWDFRQKTLDNQVRIRFLKTFGGTCQNASLIPAFFYHLRLETRAIWSSHWIPFICGVELWWDQEDLICHSVAIN